MYYLSTRFQQSDYIKATICRPLSVRGIYFFSLKANIQYSYSHFQRNFPFEEWNNNVHSTKMHNHVHTETRYRLIHKTHSLLDREQHAQRKSIIVNVVRICVYHTTDRRQFYENRLDAVFNGIISYIFDFGKSLIVL